MATVAASSQLRPSSQRAAGQATEVAWNKLAAADSFDSVVQSWLTLQLRQCAADTGAAYYSDPGPTLKPRVVAAQGDRAGEVLALSALRAMETGAPSIDRPEGKPGHAHIAHPLLDDKEIVGAVALLLTDANPQRLRNVGRMLQWGLPWLRERLALDRIAAGDRRQDAIREAHEVFAGAMDESGFRAAAIGTVTRLSSLADANRVSLGLRRRGKIEIAAVSNSAEFGKRMRVNRKVAAAMDEAVDQRAALSHPAPESEINVTRAQSELARDHGPSSILTVPFAVADAHKGAMTFERPENNPFSPDDVAFLDFAVSLAGPVLWEKRQNDKWLIWKVFDTISHQFGALFGPGHAIRKMIVVSLFLLTALFMTWTEPYRVSSDAVVEGAVERSLVVPFDGFIRSAPLRAGDRVDKGQIIAELDDRDLALERLRWVVEHKQKTLEYGRAIGEQDRAEAEIIRAQAAQAESQIRLIDAQMERAKILSPFNGVIVSGDQAQNIGGSVSRGDVLFEVAPLANYRVVIEVDESRIGDITIGQAGELIVTALPNTAFPLEVVKLTPVAVASEGRNFFRTEARLTGEVGALGPGMQGVAKIDVDDRLVIEIWTRDFIDWWRLTIWHWFG